MTAGTQDGRQKDWLMLARPAGEPGPFREYHAGAASPEEAAEILRARGLEVQRSSARLQHEPKPQPDVSQLPKKEPTLQDPGPLRCSKCSYVLADLTLEGASVVCPECSHTQRVVAWPLSTDHRRLIRVRGRLSDFLFVAAAAAGILSVAIILATLAITLWHVLLKHL